MTCSVCSNINGLRICHTGSHLGLGILAFCPACCSITEQGEDKKLGPVMTSIIDSSNNCPICNSVLVEAPSNSAGLANYCLQCASFIRERVPINSEAMEGELPLGTANQFSPADILDTLAATYRERNAVYKDNWKHIGPVMAGLFPSGLTLRTPEDFIRFHLLLLKMVKVTRYTNNWDLGHSDSLRDDAVYSAMLDHADEVYLRCQAQQPG